MKNTNNEIFAKNLKFYMEQKKVDRYQLCEALGFKYSTVCEWLSANKYPRMDKIEMLAKYFGINKSDLIEEKDFIIDDTSYIKFEKNIFSDVACPIHFNKNNYHAHYFVSGNGGTSKSSILQKLIEKNINVGGEGIKNGLKLLNAYAYIMGYQEANLKNLLDYYGELNSKGQQEAIKRVKELTYLPDYKKSEDDKTDTPAPDLLTTKK